MTLNAIIDGIDAHIGTRRAIILAFALFVLAVGGVSVFHAPDYEIIYDRSMITVPNADGTRILMCTLNIGNTGRNPQSVNIHLKSEPLQQIIIPVTVRNFGIRDRTAQSWDDGDRLMYTIEDIEPEKEVEVRFVLRIPAGEPLPEWEDILVDVKPDKGRALTGSPGMIKLLRLIYLFV